MTVATKTQWTSPGGAFLYVQAVKARHGTVTIGRDGDMEFHGASEIKGVADREGNLPWICDLFCYEQSADFRDAANGNSIVRKSKRRRGYPP